MREDKGRPESVYLMSTLRCPSATADSATHLSPFCPFHPLWHLAGPQPSTPPVAESLVLRLYLLSLTSSPKPWKPILNSDCCGMPAWSPALISTQSLYSPFTPMCVNAHVIRSLSSIHMVVFLGPSFLLVSLTVI